MNHFNSNFEEDCYIHSVKLWLFPKFQNQGYFSKLLPNLIENIKNTFPFVMRIEVIVSGRNPKMAQTLKNFGGFELSQTSLDTLNESRVTPENYFNNSTQIDKLCMIRKFD